MVVRVKEHRDPDLADFEKRKSDIVREYERTKWAELVDNWSKQKCAEVRDDGRIKVNGEVLEYEVGRKVPDRVPALQSPRVRSDRSRLQLLAPNPPTILVQ